MSKKTEKEYQEEISAMNFLLLEQKDQMNGLGAERDSWKILAQALTEKVQQLFEDRDRCRHYLMSIQPNDFKIEDCLESLGYQSDGLDH